ncbi:MAG: DUF262 domain-containing protein [Gammaproteobacteria bacterium]|nr:DUF262 domain-containing protein [Gammaproteobacteria bacterium]
MDTLENKIDAEALTVERVLSRKYVIDYFQREYRWEHKHMDQLIGDLESAFFSNYSEDHDLEDVDKYNGYYLGPVILSNKGTKSSIIDGQQRLTSLTLLLIYLNNLIEEEGYNSDDIPDTLPSLIRKKHLGKYTFNIDVRERTKCIEALYKDGRYSMEDDDDESTQNILARYESIGDMLSDKLRGKNIFPFFVNWLIHKVVFVVIEAHSVDNAYTIFETMNDRGLNLTASEMLKGYILSHIKESEIRTGINDVWKEQINCLRSYSKDEDLKFFQAWLRAKYAVTIRTGGEGAVNEDFEKISARFHTWVKDCGAEKINLRKSGDFASFVRPKFVNYSTIYRKIYDAKRELTEGLEHLHYTHAWGIASSLADPLFLAPITEGDIPDEKLVKRKLNIVARYIETFCVYRGANRRNFSLSSIRYTLSRLVIDIRDKSIEELGQILKDRLSETKEDLHGLLKLRLHGQNKKFIKFFLSRLTQHIEQESNKPSTFAQYFFAQGKSRYEIEHIWADKVEHHRDEFDQNEEFKKKRNMLGGLLLLPASTNAAHGADLYEKKVKYYLKENLLAQSLHEDCYSREPDFLRYKEKSGLSFKPHSEFKSSDMKERQQLYYEIAKEIWSLDFFDADEVS